MNLRKAAEMALNMFDWLERRSMYQDLQMKETHEALRQALAQPEQEPEAWTSVEDPTYLSFGKPNWVTPIPLYTAPPKREWVGLTDADIDAYALDEGVTADKAPPWLVKYARDIEAKLKEKNGG